ncbi:MAG: tetratricopeptide repeat protein, partial [Methyloprofundus sp.]|nr:tetratricopeptide repeat protein [Methyloprofundus sp.]
LFAQESSVHLSPNASKKSVNKGLLIGVLLSSIAVFFVYLAISKPKPTTAIVSKPLAIPALKLAPKQPISQAKHLALINNITIDAQPKPLESTASLVKPEPMPVVAKALKNTAKTLPNLSAPTVIEPPQAENSIKAAPLSMTQQAKSLYQQALKANNTEQAINLLKQSLKLAPEQSNTRLFLTKLLINTGEKQAATDLLDESLAISPQATVFIMARAQLYLQEKNPQRALELLTQMTAPPQNEAYLALLAAAYQQHKSYTQSSVHYQTLVQLNPDKAQYWLGLALAQDALNQKQAAHNAYQQALNLHSLNPAVTDYIQHRLQQLP